MGWLDRKQRRRARKEFRVRALYLCDVCEQPIPSGELIVIDPRKGYYPRPEGVSVYVSKEPKWTSHYDCDPVKKRREKRKAKKELLLHVADNVLVMISKKPIRGYWTKEKLCRKLEFEQRLVLRAIKLLRKQNRIKKRGDGYLLR